MDAFSSQYLENREYASNTAGGRLSPAKKNPARFVFSRILVSMLLIAGVGDVTIEASEPSSETKLEFNRDIRPILAEQCFACHGLDSMSRAADLRLDQRDAAIEMGAIVPEDAESSELVSRIFSDDPDIVMPPLDSHKKLTDVEKETLRRWVDEGAEYQPHWSTIRPHRADPPDVAVDSVDSHNWPNNAIDKFVFAKLNEHKLVPSTEAEPHRLFRRMHLDVTGLPPSPEDLTQFIEDYSAEGHDAYSSWIDRLMESLAWGEHRARYWLDAARYADTHGMHFDNYREMWPYRDWVIRAFNANQPFDQFVVEQIAGDLLGDPTPQQLVATGFQRCCMTTNEGGTIDEENLAIYAADRVQTFGWVFLGLTTNCCQCHDHKFDPITINEYYSLAAFFRNTTQPPLDGNEKKGGGPFISLPNETDSKRFAALPGEISELDRGMGSRRGDAADEYHAWRINTLPELAAQEQVVNALVIQLPLNERGLDQVDGVTATGELEWTEVGILGPATKLSTAATFDLGDRGGFALNEPFSVGAWVKTVDTNPGGALFARMANENNHRGWDVYLNGRNFAVHIIDKWPDNALKVVTNGDTIRPGQWQHVLATYDGSGKPGGIRIYVDGKFQPTRTETETLSDDAVIQADTSLRIGQRSNGNYFNGGSVQDFRLYERALDDVEVQTISQSALLKSAASTPYSEIAFERQDQLYQQFLSRYDAVYRALQTARNKCRAELDQIVERSPVTLVQKERDQPAMAHVLMRGAYDQPGEQLAASTPAFLPPMPETAPKNRLGLAEWLIDPAHPLLARVTVNRFWQQLFGHGLVVTAEDFGVMGSPPSHPDLLDWLAVEFRESGWDVKRIFKLMLMSSTYRQSAAVAPSLLEKDRHNQWLARGPRFRMDAEMVRDSALQVSQLLSKKMFGPGVKPYQPDHIWDVVGLPDGDTRMYVRDKGESLHRRSVYTFWKRMAPHPSLESFNAPSREVCTVRRERTNTPLQALVTLNDPQYVEAARCLAERILSGADESVVSIKDVDGQDIVVLTRAAKLVLGRFLTKEEAEILLATKTKLDDHYQVEVDAASQLLGVGDAPVNEALDKSTLAAWTMICNQLLNLDEALTK